MYVYVGSGIKAKYKVIGKEELQCEKTVCLQLNEKLNSQGKIVVEIEEKEQAAFSIY